MGTPRLLRGELLDAANQPLGRLEVLVSYQYLMEGILTSGWMQTQMACLVNVEGHYLAHSSPMMQNRHCLGETHEARAKYGIVGSSVNLTHRIQGQAKGGEVVISEPAYQKGTGCANNP
jgi:hypothetical protein